MLPLYFFIFLLVSGCSISQSKNEKRKDVQDKQNIRFCSIPIVEATSANLPCILIEIEGQSIPVIVDLGFRGFFSLFEDLLGTIQKKTFLQDREVWGFGGKQYKHAIYRVPKINIGGLSFYDFGIEAQSRAFKSSAQLTNLPDIYPECGSVGWKLFEDVNLFLDLGHDLIAICDSVDTLKEQGCLLDSFVTVPFWTDRGLIEFEIETSKGLMRCILDSGSTWNLYRSNKEEWDLNDRVDDPVLRVGGKNFKPQSFLFLPFHHPLPEDVNAFLGMDFLVDHVVFIEFTTGKIHIAPRN